MNLLNQREVHVRLEPETKNATVHLISSVCIPAIHSKIVNVKAAGNIRSTATLFESSRDDLAKHGLVIDDGLVEPDNEDNFKIPTA